MDQAAPLWLTRVAGITLLLVLWLLGIAVVFTEPMPPVPHGGFSPFPIAQKEKRE